MYTVSLTRVSPASNVALSQVLRCFLPPFRQACRKYGVTVVHTLSAVTSVTAMLRQAHQGQVVVAALRKIARMQDDSVHGVFVLVFFANEGVIIADAYFIRTGADTVPERKKEQERGGLHLSYEQVGCTISALNQLRRQTLCSTTSSIKRPPPVAGM